jgi:hypothetical protein
MLAFSSRCCQSVWFTYFRYLRRSRMLRSTLALYFPYSSSSLGATPISLARRATGLGTWAEAISISLAKHFGQLTTSPETRRHCDIPGDVGQWLQWKRLDGPLMRLCKESFCTQECVLHKHGDSHRSHATRYWCDVGCDLGSRFIVDVAH